MTAVTVQRRLGEVQSWPPTLIEALPEGPWTVVHVKPRQEKLLAANLRHLRIPSVLFLEHRVRTYARQGVQSSVLPLLPGYLFMAADESAFAAVYATARVVRMLPVRNPADLRSDLTDLAALVTRADAPLLVRPELVPGMVVQLHAGSMAGLRGVIDRRKGRSELVVNIRMLGTSVAVTCAAADVDAAQA